MYIPPEVRDEWRRHLEVAFKGDATDAELRRALEALLDLAERCREKNPEAARMMERQAEILSNRLGAAYGDEREPEGEQEESGGDE